MSIDSNVAIVTEVSPFSWHSIVGNILWTVVTAVGLCAFCIAVLILLVWVAIIGIVLGMCLAIGLLVIATFNHPQLSILTVPLIFYLIFKMITFITICADKKFSFGSRKQASETIIITETIDEPMENESVMIHEIELKSDESSTIQIWQR